MKFVVATYGTEGDVRPFAALCRGLIDAGHEARLLADAATLSSARALGVPAAALAGDIRGALERDRRRRRIAKGGGFSAHRARAWPRIANAHAEILAAQPHRGRRGVRCVSWRRGWQVSSVFPRPNTWASRPSAPG